MENVRKVRVIPSRLVEIGTGMSTFRKFRRDNTRLAAAMEGIMTHAVLMGVSRSGNNRRRIRVSSDWVEMIEV